METKSGGSDGVVPQPAARSPQPASGSAFSAANYSAVLAHVTRLVRRCARDADQAEDAVSRALARARTELGGDVTPREVVPWALHAARNLVFSMRRADARRAKFAPPLHHHTSGVATSVVFGIELQRAIDQLADGDRHVLAMLHDGCVTQEIAVVRGVGDRAVRKAIDRIRRVFERCGISRSEFRFDEFGSEGQCEQSD